MAEAQRVGQTPAEIAARAKISVTIFAKLERRLIRAASVPEKLIDDLAAAIGRSTDALSAYLGGGATLPSGAMYRSTAAPSVSGDEDFFAAIAADRTIRPEDRAAWLALAPQPGQDA